MKLFVILLSNDLDTSLDCWYEILQKVQQMRYQNDISLPSTNGIVPLLRERFRSVVHLPILLHIPYKQRNDCSAVRIFEQSFLEGLYFV